MNSSNEKTEEQIGHLLELARAITEALHSCHLQSRRDPPGARRKLSEVDQTLRERHEGLETVHGPLPDMRTAVKRMTRKGTGNPHR